MALQLADRVQQTGTANTTVSFNLSGSVSGYQSFSSAITTGNTTYYAASDGTNWEVGIGTLTSSSLLTRTTILASSNSGSGVTFSGTVNVFVTYPSEKSVNLDGSNNVSALGTIASGTWQGSTVGVAYGGTGQTSYTDGQLLIGNTTGNTLTKATLTAGSGISVTNAGGAITIASTVASTTWQSVQTSNFTAASGNGYPVNTTSAAITVTFPASPSAGNIIILTDYAGTWNTNNVIIAGNGNKIISATTNLLLQNQRESVSFVYIDSTQGWLPYSGFQDAIPISSTYSATYLVIAGGGGGGSWSGGGGAGGYRTSTTTLTTGTAYTVTVGAGGAGGASFADGSSGNNSVFNAITSLGGGAGTYNSSVSGGSGGGVGNGFSGGAGTSGQGNNGGTGSSSAPYQSGGGGAGAVGGNPGGGNPGGFAGAGGAGSASSISGSSVTYAGGGGGGGAVNAGGAWSGGSGGSGGGGAGGTSGDGTSGSTNTGGGGGAGGRNTNTAYTSGSGGSGVVIISVPTARYSGTTTGSPSVTTSGSNTILTYNSSGSYTA